MSLSILTHIDYSIVNTPLMRKFLQMKKIGIAFWLALLLITVYILFCCNIWIEYHPISVPKHRPVAFRRLLSLDGILNPLIKSIFFGFFNTACPCSQFNRVAFKSLIGLYVIWLDNSIISSDYTTDLGPYQLYNNKSRYNIITIANTLKHKQHSLYSLKTCGPPADYHK